MMISRVHMEEFAIEQRKDNASIQAADLPECTELWKTDLY